ncbi:hypothetical protein RB598_002374 [Gaeumannomyces tritici]
MFLSGASVAAAFLFLLPLATLAQQIPVTGIQGGGDGAPLPARKNIKDLQRNGGPEWDLFILGLTALQDEKETNELSYFQLMGIHGRPYIPWNGVERVAGGGYGGFCPHNSVQFASWHRPFLAIYEQAIHTHVVRIAGEYKGQSAPVYAAAARRVRIPYWDWAAGGSGDSARLPEAVTAREVTVTTPSGRASVRNPLYSYRFQRRPDESGMPNDTLGARFGETKRGPTANGTDDFGAVNAQLEAHAGTLARQVYNVFTQTTTFAQMSTEQVPGSSFESPHNSIHNMAGAGGHLQFLDWSAFDPAFALHHCNVDRLVALWQAVNPDGAVLNGSAWSSGQFATPAGQVTADSPLRPFFASNRSGHFHTGRSVADVASFGYTYPELLPPPPPPQRQEEQQLSRADLRRLVMQRINDLYGAGVGAGQSLGKRDAAAVAAHRDYELQIRAERDRLDLPAQIGVFVRGRLAGHVSLLGMPRTGVSFSVLPLDGVLTELGLVDNRTEAAVLPLLRDEVRLEVRKCDGTDISAASTPGLQLEVQSRAYKPGARKFDFPTFGAVSKVAIHPITPRP